MKDKYLKKSDPVEGATSIQDFMEKCRDKQIERHRLETEELKNFDLFDSETKEKVTVEVTHVGGQEFKALCPKHDDHNPSLFINLEKEVFNCQGCGWSGKIWDDKKHGKPDDEEPDKESDQDPSGEILATYDYRNAHGDLLFQTVKLSAPPPKNKTFRQRRSDGNGGWIWNLNETVRVLYRLHELLTGQDPVFICEGEKDVDNLRTLGLTATTNPMGAGKWNIIYNPCLAGRDVIILPDNDEPGKKHSTQVAQSLLGTAKSVKVLTLPDLPEKGDVSDFLTKLAGITKEQFLEVASTADDWKELKEESGIKKNNYNLITGKELMTLKEIEKKWFWDGVLPAGGLSLVLAKPKVGKTVLCLNLAFNTPKGRTFLGKDITKGKVIYLALEESRIEVQKSLVEFEKTHGELDMENMFFHFGIAPTDAIQKLEKLMEEIEPTYVVIDILQKFLRLKKIEDYAEVITKLEPVMDIARRLDCHITLTHHAPKAERELIDSALGSTGLAASVDTVILIKKDVKGRRSFSTAQRYRKDGAKDIEDWVIALSEDDITLELAGTTSEVNVSETRDQILKLLGSVGTGFYLEPMTEPQIREVIQKSKTFTLKCLKELYQENVIKRDGTGHKNSPFRYSLFE